MSEMFSKIAVIEIHGWRTPVYKRQELRAVRQRMTRTRISVKLESGRS